MLCREYAGKSIPFRANGEDKEVVYLTRVDPLTGSVAKISEDRARRQIGITVNLSVQATPTCDFCSYATKTPERRIEHQCGGVGRRQPVVEPVHPEIGDRGHVDQHSRYHHQRNRQQQQLAGQAKPARRHRPRRFGGRPFGRLFVSQ